LRYTAGMLRGGRVLLSLLLAALLGLPACPPATAQPAQPARSAGPSLAADKALHFLLGASCALLVSAAAAPAWRDSPLPDPAYALCVSGAGLGAALGAGAAKELLDRAGFGQPEWSDFLATAAGGLAVAAVVFAAGAGDRDRPARLSPVYASFGVVLMLPPAADLLRRLSSRRSSASSE
jgi:hypothetical protein